MIDGCRGELVRGTETNCASVGGGGGDSCLLSPTPHVLAFSDPSAYTERKLMLQITSEFTVSSATNPSSNKRMILMALIQRVGFLSVLILLMGPWQSVCLAQAPSFTRAQVSAGRTDYRTHCASCHGRQLEGLHLSPSLARGRFDSVVARKVRGCTYVSYAPHAS